MCVIVHLEKDKTISKKQLELCYNRNPHGWGIMFARDGVIKTHKEVSNFKEFLKVWKDIPTDAERAIHFRIKTHGEVNDANCHPFSPIPDVYMMHNGVIDTVLVEEKMNDTHNYCTYELGPIMKAWPNWIDDNQFKEVVNKGVGSSRLLFMDNTGKVLKINQQEWKWRDGCSFSNGSSFTYEAATNRQYAGGYSSAYDEDYNSAGYRGWSERAAGTQDYSGLKNHVGEDDETIVGGSGLEKINKDISLEDRYRLLSAPDVQEHIRAVQLENEIDEEEDLKEAMRQVADEATDKMDEAEFEDDELPFVPMVEDLLTMPHAQLVEFVEENPHSAARTIETLLSDGVNAGYYNMEITGDEVASNTTKKEGVAG